VPELVPPPTVERFRRWGIVVWTLIGMLILAYVALRSVLTVREIFPPLVVAIVTIYTLNPFVTRLETLGIRRVFGGCLAYFVLLTIVGVGLALLIPVLIHQGQAFARDFPQTIDRLGDMANRLGDTIERRFGTEVNLQEWIGGRSDLAADTLKRVGGFLTAAAETLTLIIIGLVVGFYLLIDLPRLSRSTLRLVPPDRRGEVRTIAHDVGAAMGGFFRGQLMVAFIVGVMSSIGLLIIGLPYWAVVGLIAGFFNLIPLIGPFVGAVPAIIIALALKPPVTALFVIIVLTVVQQIDNHFISPNVMRWSVRLHPVTVMLSLTIGAALGGFFGMLVTVPMVASVKVVGTHLWRTRVPWGGEVFGDEPDERGPPHLETTKTTERPPVLGEGEPPSE
jgi:predicted PurR-regulated permease PerM